jgi:RNA polymerase sigma-70 factor (ECF subfamily)
MIQDLLKELKPTDRAAIVLRYWHQASEVEIAETLNLSVSAVKSRLFRARQALAKSYMAAESPLTVSERRPDESPAL